LLLPLAVVALARRRLVALVAGMAGASVVAEIGRRRAGGRAVYRVSSTLLAGPWLLWRSVCSWAALGARLRGGVRYRDVRLARAATPRRELQRRVSRSIRAG
jgi:hypothetical protein